MTTEEAMKGLKPYRVLTEMTVFAKTQEDAETTFFEQITDSPDELTILSIEEE